MALALIDFIEFDKNRARFNIDTGTNNFYKLKIGKSKTEVSGVKWVDEIIHATPLKNFNQAANLLNTNREIALPANYFNNNGIYVQLFSFKNQMGKSPAFSRIVTMPANLSDDNRAEFLSMQHSMNNDPMLYGQLNDCRSITGVNGQYAYQTGFEDLLGRIIQVAGPIITNLLKANQNNQSSPAANSGAQSPVGLLNAILNSLLNGFGTAQVNNVSRPQSLYDNDTNENRFAGDSQTQFSQPFFAFAALIPLLGPIIQALPGLLNASAENRLKMRQENNKLTTDIFSDVNKRMMLLQILQHMPENASAGNTDVNQLMQMIQQMPEAPAATPAASAPSASVPALAALAPLAPVSISHSLSNKTKYSASLSASTILNFEFSKTTTWNGLEKNIFSHGSDLKLSLKLAVAGAIPKNPLAKAILKICFRDMKTGKNYLEKTFKQKNVLPNTPIELSFSKEESSIVPANVPVNVFGEMRWQTRSGKEIKALGTAEIILSSQYFIRESGRPVSDERELKDVKVYKSFWNKVWESPVMDAANQRDPDKKKYRWSLDANGKYSYSLTAQHDSNGVSDTKFLSGEADTESLTEKTEGRLKAGMELSISELNKLSALWDGQTLMPQEKLLAFKNDLFANNNSAEFIFNFKLDGSSRERGMIWVVPVFKLFEFNLSKVKETNEGGQVTAVEEEKIQFPLPVAARILGLKSE